MSSYAVGILTLLSINCIAALGVSLLTGFTGVFTLGHAGYMAIGAYTAAILTTFHGVHWLPAVIAGGLLAMIVAYLIGLPTLKLDGDYYTIASLGLGEAIRLIIANWEGLTRGARGIPGIAGFTTLPVALAFFAVMAVFMFFLIHSSYGRAFKACRDDCFAAGLLGINTARMRVLSLAVSGLYCGIAGALFAGFISFIQPAMFSTAKSTELVSIVVFGGLGSMSGSLAATVILTLVTELFRPISLYRMLVYGCVLVFVMVLHPEGLMGTNELTPSYVKGVLARLRAKKKGGAPR